MFHIKLLSFNLLAAIKYVDKPPLTHIATSNRQIQRSPNYTLLSTALCTSCFVWSPSIFNAHRILLLFSRGEQSVFTRPFSTVLHLFKNCVMYLGPHCNCCCCFTPTEGAPHGHGRAYEPGESLYYLLHRGAMPTP